MNLSISWNWTQILTLVIFNSKLYSLKFRKRFSEGQNECSHFGLLQYYLISKGLFTIIWQRKIFLSASNNLAQFWPFKADYILFYERKCPCLVKLVNWTFLGTKKMKTNINQTAVLIVINAKIKFDNLLN